MELQNTYEVLIFKQTRETKGPGVRLEQQCSALIQVVYNIHVSTCDNTLVSKMQFKLASLTFEGIMFCIV